MGLLVAARGFLWVFLFIVTYFGSICLLVVHCGSLWLIVSHCDPLWWFLVVYYSSLWVFFEARISTLQVTVSSCDLMWPITASCISFIFTLAHFGSVWLIMVYSGILCFYCTIMKFSMTDFFNKCNQICSFLQIWSHYWRNTNAKLHANSVEAQWGRINHNEPDWSTVSQSESEWNFVQCSLCRDKKRLLSHPPDILRMFNWASDEYKLDGAVSSDLFGETIENITLKWIE